MEIVKTFSENMPDELLKINHKYLLMKYDENGKKIVKGNFKNVNWTYNDAYEQQFKQYNDYSIVRAFDLKNSGYIVVDIDQDIDLNELCKLHPVLGDTCCKKGNSKGFHFYFRNKELSNLKTEIKCLKGIEGDVITGTVWEAVDCKFNHNIVSDIL